MPRTILESDLIKLLNNFYFTSYKDGIEIGIDDYNMSPVQAKELFSKQTLSMLEKRMKNEIQKFVENELELNESKILK